MDKKWVERQIVEHIEVDGCECNNVLEICASPAAHIIAQAHEEELQGAETKWDLHLVGQQKRIEELAAQVAVMEQAADGLRQQIAVLSGAMHTMDEQVYEMEKALFGMPEVLAHVELAQEYDDISETLNYATGWEPPQDVEVHIEVFGKAQARFSKVKEIEVFILTPLSKPEE
jgi:uncharacterized coiled-coil protein SlyX